MWNKKQKRAYHRAKSGVKVQKLKKIPLKHCVLTSSPSGSMRDSLKDFAVLRKRIIRELEKPSKCRWKDIPVPKNEKLNVTFKNALPYFLVHTNEGQHSFIEKVSKRGKITFFLLGGVLHVLFAQKFYIPVSWLSKQWAEIHGSPNVSIREIQDDDIARYMVTQYVSAQTSSYQRCSYSQGWVCKGFVNEWKRLIRWFHQWQKKLNLTFKDLLTKFDKWLTDQVLKYRYKQTVLY
jgi:hypothetical protein